jgi:hypothetical protein
VVFKSEIFLAASKLWFAFLKLGFFLVGYLDRLKKNSINMPKFGIKKCQQFITFLYKYQ